MRDNADEQPELTAISSLVFWKVERKWEEIATYIREGCRDPQFLFVLRRLLSPDASLYGIRLVVCRPEGRPVNLKSADGTHVLIRLLHFRRRERRGLELIACEIEDNGLADERLRADLAAMFSRQEIGPLEMWFDVAKARKGQPRRSAKLEVQNFLELHADIFEEKPTDVVAAASLLFGLSEETVKSYRKQRRRLRRRESETWCPKLEEAVARTMREAGYPEYQPLSEILKNRDL